MNENEELGRNENKEQDIFQPEEPKNMNEEERYEEAPASSEEIQNEPQEEPQNGTAIPTETEDETHSSEESVTVREEIPDKNYTYVWDGSKFVANKKKKSRAVFACIVGVALIISAIAFIAAVMVYSRKPIEPAVSGEESKTVSVETSSGGGNKKINIVVDPTEIEHGDIAALYEACAPACCTVRLTGIGHGSGFVVDTENGYVVTNHHVIENYQKYKTAIEVVFYDGRTYEAKVVGSDSVTDIAVLQIEAEDLVALPIGDSTSSKVGDTVITIGTPYSESLQGTLSRGVVSGIDREFEIKNSNGSVAGTVTYIQIDAAISSGNSGGPLINMNGQVIGINSMTIHEQSSIFSSSENVYNSLNFAIPMSYGAEVINELIEYGEVKSHAQYVKSTPKLGITIYIKSTSSDEAKQEYGLPDDVPAGLLVIEISRSSAIYKAGLELYDIITKFNDTEITEQADLLDALAERAVGDKVTITVYRMSRRGGGQYVELTFNLEGSAN